MLPPTPLLTIEQARNHLRAQGVADDADLQLKINAATLMAQQFTCRRIFATQVELDDAVAAETAGEYPPLVADDLIRAALLLSVGHLYGNREDVVTGTIATELPQGSRALLNFYRQGMGV